MGTNRQRADALIAMTVVMGGLLTTPAEAWIYPEHRDIALLSVDTLDPQRRHAFDALWKDARAGNAERLCADGADLKQRVVPPCIDWAAFPAIAGDHSCSAREMLSTVVESDWILDVADVSAQLKLDLSEIEVSAPAGQGESTASKFRRRMASAGERAARINALRTADMRLQGADPGYATRAGSNNAHFLLARPDLDTSPTDYGWATIRPDSEVNAMGIYGWYHVRALKKATRLANEVLRPEQRGAVALAMFADEAFALHFLEDVYTAGHVAGTWGDASQRKGTHDYYNEVGLEVFPWEPGSKPVVLMGDAHMRPEDAEVAAKAVRISLEQVLDVATGREGTHRLGSGCLRGLRLHPL